MEVAMTELVVGLCIGFVLGYQLGLWTGGLKRG